MQDPDKHPNAPTSPIQEPLKIVPQEQPSAPPQPIKKPLKTVPYEKPKEAPPPVRKPLKIVPPPKKSNLPKVSPKKTPAPSSETSDAKKLFEFYACKYFCGNRKNPICGTDGKTYKNECFYFCVKRTLKKNLSIEYPGECLDLALRRKVGAYLMDKFEPEPINKPNEDLEKSADTPDAKPKEPNDEDITTNKFQNDLQNENLSIITPDV